MAKRAKRIKGLKGIGYSKATDTFKFALLDRSSVPHSYACDYPTFEHIVQEFDTRYAQAEQLRKPKPGPLIEAHDETIRIDVGATADGRIRLSINSAGSKSFEVRFDASVAPSLIESLQRAQAYVEGKQAPAES